MFKRNFRGKLPEILKKIYLDCEKMRTAPILQVILDFTTDPISSSSYSVSLDKANNIVAHIRRDIGDSEILCLIEKFIDCRTHRPDAILTMVKVETGGLDAFVALLNADADDFYKAVESVLVEEMYNEAQNKAKLN